MNPWLYIPLADYGAHMALPQVAQAQMPAELLRCLVNTHRPESLAVPGVAGGNGLEAVCGTATYRVVAVDVNEEYLNARRIDAAGFEQAVYVPEAGAGLCMHKPV